MPRVSPPPRSLDQVKKPHLQIGEFARFMAVSTTQVWKWHYCGKLELIVPGDGKRGARIHIDEARRFYETCRRPAA